MLIFLALAFGIGFYGQYIQDTGKQYHVKSMNVTFGSPSISYEFSTSEGSKSEFTYSPEVAQYTGIEIESKNFGIGFSFTDGSSGKEVDDKDYRPTSRAFRESI